MTNTLRNIGKSMHGLEKLDSAYFYLDRAFVFAKNENLESQMAYILSSMGSIYAEKGLYEKAGNLNGEFDGAQDYDFVLRCVEHAKNVVHIPKVLYHWRAHKDSTAENPESKLYAFEAGARAVQAHYDRVGINAKVESTKYLGIYRSTYQLQEKPLISIIIPNKDHIEDLDKCITSIEMKSTYKNVEYIIVE